MSAPVPAYEVKIRKTIAHVKGAPSPYRVKWSVAGRETSRAFRLKVQAEQWHGELTQAIKQHQEFCPLTRRPLAQSQARLTVLEQSRELVHKRWQTWAPGSRRAAVEALAPVLRHLVVAGRGRGTAAAETAWLKYCYLDANPDTLEYRSERSGVSVNELQAAGDWLLEHSMGIEQIDLDAVENALSAAGHDSSGKLLAYDSLGRQRTHLSAVCREAVRKKRLSSNPVREAERLSAQVEETDEVEPTEYPGPEECRHLVRILGEVSATSWQWQPYISTLWMVGLRPSEATRLRVGPDVALPAKGWGELKVRGGTVSTGRRYTGTEDGIKDRPGPKWRRRGSVRIVPIPPELVVMLRSHISRRELRDGDRLFQNGNGKPVCPHQLGKCWRVARRKAFGERYPNLRMQDLRHVAASVALRAGCSVVEVSERLGNSPATLMRVYAHVLAGDRERSNARIEAALRAAS